MTTTVLERPATAAPSSAEGFAPPRSALPAPAPSRGLRRLVARHPVLAYYVLAFGLTWGVLLGALGGTTLGTDWQADPRLPIIVAATLGGPSVAGLLLTGLVDGLAGYRELLRRLRRWRVGWRWYAAALLPAPLLFAAVQGALSLASPAFTPAVATGADKAALLLAGVLPGLVIGLCEELGWTGFAIPRLRRRHGLLATGLLAGSLWGAWHLLTNDLWIAESFAGDLGPPLFAVLTGVTLLSGQLVAYRVLMVRLYERTGSLLVAALMHASLSACTVVFASVPTGTAYVASGVAYAAAWWTVVAAVVLAGRRRPAPEGTLA